MITLGGDAELELVDSLDPFSEVAYIPKIMRALAFFGIVHLMTAAR